MPPLVLAVDDCRAAYDRMHAAGVEFTQQPMSRYGSVDAGFRDPSGNGWKMVEARRGGATWASPFVVCRHRGATKHVSQ
jgi:extradiol dioxygenase family protein